MPAAQTYKIEELAPFLMLAIEDNYDTEKALVPADVIATSEITPKIFEGESEEIRFDGDGGIDRFETYYNNRNAFDLKMLGAASGTKGVPPTIGKLLRICGANEFITAGSEVRYSMAHIGSLDSATVKMFEEKGIDEYLEYLATGVRGQVGFGFQDGKMSRFNLSNLMGAYHKPKPLNQAVARDWGNQKSQLPKNVNFANTAALTFDGHQLCVESLDIPNLFGLEVSRLDLPGCRSTNGKRVPITGNIKFRMPDWEQAFNPYTKADTDGGIKRLPFELQIGHTGTDDGHILQILGAGDNETQLGRPERTTLSDGTLGIQAPLRFLTGLDVIHK